MVWGSASDIAWWLREKFSLEVLIDGHYQTYDVEWGLPYYGEKSKRHYADKGVNHPWQDAWSKYGFGQISGWDEWDRAPDVEHIVISFGRALAKVLTEAGYKATNTMSIDTKQGCKYKQEINGRVEISWATGQLAEAS